MAYSFFLLLQIIQTILFVFGPLFVGNVMGVASVNILWLFMKLVVCGGIGLYLIIDGKLLFDILDRERPALSENLPEKYVELAD